MKRVIKSEWHQVEKRYGVEVDQYLIETVYPELDSEEAEQRLAEILSGEFDLDEFKTDVIDCADIDWEWLDEDDWWTDRKGGYDVSYDVETD